MRRKVSISIFAAGFLMIGIALVFPVKLALRQSDLAALGKPYYLVEWTQTTVANWKIVGDQTGYYQSAKYVRLDGKTPGIVRNYAVASGHNTYVCYGEYLGETDTPAIEGTIGAYRIDGWDILYPVRREAVFPLWPKSWLTLLDAMGG